MCAFLVLFISSLWEERDGIGVLRGCKGAGQAAYITGLVFVLLAIACRIVDTGKTKVSDAIFHAKGPYDWVLLYKRHVGL
jgi:hypothetical protein